MPAVLTELMARDGNNNNGKAKGRGNIFNRRMKDEQRSNGLLQPMLSGQQRLLGSSEGDINQNLNLSSASSPSLLVDGNNNNNSNDDLEAASAGRGGTEDRVINIPVDRRKSTVEPLQRHHRDEERESQLLINHVAQNGEGGIGAEEDFDDIDGSEGEDEDEAAAEDREGDKSSSSDAFRENNPLKQLPPSTPVSLCSSNC